MSQSFEQQVEGLMDFFHRSGGESVKPAPGTVHGKTFSQYANMLSTMTPGEVAARAKELGLHKNATLEQVIVALWNAATQRRDRRGYDRPF